jgi:hypothetical protein
MDKASCVRHRHPHLALAMVDAADLLAAWTDRPAPRGVLRASVISVPASKFHPGAYFQSDANCVATTSS